MAVPYSFYYDVADDRTLDLPFPTSVGLAVAEITSLEIEDQDGLDPGVATTLIIDWMFGFQSGTIRLQVEIISVGNDGSLLVEAGDISGSVINLIISLFPGDGDLLLLTDTPGLDGSNLDDLGVFDLEDPFIPPGQEFTYSEGQGEGFLVGTVTATDNEDVTGFSILDGDDDGFFQINADGEISLTAAGVAAAAASNDFETQPNVFSLEIEAIDAAGNRYSEVVAVLLTDIDDEDPVISQGQSFNYAEGQSEGFVVGNVTASDNQEVSGFSILNGNDNGFFQINTDGVISLTAAGAAAAAASNDFETGPNDFSLEIEAFDAAGNTSSEIVTVLVSDIDDEDPVISQGQSFSYAEGQSAGFVVGTVLATDNVAVTGYSITAGDSSGFFDISATGEISLTAAGAAAAAASNDFETGSNDFSLTVETTDAAGNTGSGIVTVSVTDVFEAGSIIGTNRRDILYGSREGETIEGLRGNDLIFGWKGDDVILGGSGRDFIFGGQGADDITGGTGKDAVIGGRGEDLFILTEGSGWDYVLDFRQGEDQFGLRDDLTFDDLSFSGNRILAGSDLLAVVLDFQTSDLSENDFLIL